MYIYDLYGSFSADINEAKVLIESALGIKFDARNGDYQGGDYFECDGPGDENFILKRNIDPYDDEPIEMKFPKHQILFYINDTLRSAELKMLIEQGAGSLALLRHDEIE